MDVQKRTAQYKHHHNSNMYSKPNFIRLKEVFVDKPTLSSSAKSTDNIASASYKELQLQKAGPFLIIKVQSRTVVINDSSIPNTVLIHQIAAASEPKSRPICSGAETHSSK